ncbi:hypothetical protein TNCV_3940721 [Trichonephila clavipes]|uniref:Uncharacterized protein n=1 Tax=Trichonephila clavipes TaxID=2585209 RepID=A0A8X6VVW6_TRICX|nr:hypothetical protein TNCV_3940721 [Trichonephila clavipes]
MTQSGALGLTNQKGSGQEGFLSQQFDIVKSLNGRFFTDLRKVNFHHRLRRPIRLLALERGNINVALFSYMRAFGDGPLILNHGQVTRTTPELAPPLLTTTPTGGRLSSRQI